MRFHCLPSTADLWWCWIGDDICVIGCGKQKLGFFPKVLDCVSSKTNNKLLFGQWFGLTSVIIKLLSGSAERPEKEWQSWYTSFLAWWFFPVWLEKPWVEQWSGHPWGTNLDVPSPLKSYKMNVSEENTCWGIISKLGFLLFSVFQKGHPTDQSCKQGSLPTRLWW